MKALKAILFFLTIASSSFGQDFEGKVIYRNEYTSKISNLSSEQFTSMMGTTQIYLLKGGDYKSLTNGTFAQWQLYINKDNKLYNKMSHSPTVFWLDGAVNTDEILKVEINKEVTEVLGYLCDELIFTCKSGIKKYYFSSKIKIDPKLYEQHKYGNWNEILLRTNGLPLKMILDSTQFSVVSTATEITSEKLDSKIFELPEGIKVEKSQ
ncbi:MAG: hypothetical protein HOP08_02445 [Cyclobacteriaceae bacterium]|nr:hypothetical protein [Cyclobacteriaceae bacterium]